MKKHLIILLGFFVFSPFLYSADISEGEYEGGSGDKPNIIRHYLLYTDELEIQTSFTLIKTFTDGIPFSGLWNFGVSKNLFGVVEPFIYLPGFVAFNRYKADQYVNQVLMGTRVGTYITERVPEIGIEAELGLPNDALFAMVRGFCTVMLFENFWIFASVGSTFEFPENRKRTYELTYDIGAFFKFYKFAAVELTFMRPTGYEPQLQPFYSLAYHRPLNIVRIKFNVLNTDYMSIFFYTNIGLTKYTDEVGLGRNITLGIKYRY